MIKYCLTCYYLMTRKRVGDEIETICLRDHKAVSRVIECDAWQERKEAVEQGKVKDENG